MITVIVAIGIILVIAFVVNRVLKFVGNHIQYNTESNERLADRIEDMIDLLEDKMI